MQEDRSNSHASITRTFIGNEDNIIDELLGLIKRDKWENLELHYERSTLSAERTDMVVREYDGDSEEVPLTLALCCTWFSADDEVELMIEIDEPELDWTEGVCSDVGAKMIQELSIKLPTATEKDNGHGAH